MKRYRQICAAVCILLLAAALPLGAWAAGDYAEHSLRPVEVQAYRELKAAILDIAANGGSTEILLSTEFTMDGWDTDASGDALNAELAAHFKAAFDISKIVDCLLADCPFELYWYDKTGGCATVYSVRSKRVAAGEPITVSNIRVRLTPSADCRGEGEYTVAPSAAVAASAAVENARRIVAEQRGKSDLERLTAYKDAVCAGAVYNNAAAGGVAYGAPWQAVDVLRGDKVGEVVCEGYSKAFQYLCELDGGLTCFCVSGTMSIDGGARPHMWNLVISDGKTYLADVTNSDAGSIGDKGGLFLVEPTAGADGSDIVELNGRQITFTLCDADRALYAEFLSTENREDLPDVKTFADVPESGWVADAVAFVTSRGLFNGTAPDRFSPDAEMTRGMLAAVLYNAASKPQPQSAHSFSDVAETAYYADAVRWAAERGIVAGYEDGSFRPDAAITREQLVTMLYRYAESPAVSDTALAFPDAERVSGYAVDAVRFAVGAGLLAGRDDGRFDPQGTATRAEVATLLMRYFKTA